MPLMIAKEKLLLDNALRLADQHREHCEGAACNIALSLIYELLERAGIEVSADDRRRFL